MIVRTDASLDGIADDQCRASSVPLRAERGPGQFLTLREATIQL